MTEGVVGLRVEWKGGGPGKLAATQKARLVELLQARAGGGQLCWWLLERPAHPQVDRA
ncbi:MAG: hypothetical protein HPY83_13055 [Anaerolineae bacterium]|nr:hypothetical protein [Anaerolineae bacterium]